MKVFVTGASGHIGSAVVPELIEAGHEVVGLARSDASAAAIEASGAEARRGDLDDLDGLREAAAESDGVIHLAFKHELMLTGDFTSAVDTDLGVVEAIGEALEGSDKPFVSTSGTMMLLAAELGRPGTELDVMEAGPRIDAENTVIGLAERGVRSSVVRLPPSVHSDLDQHGFVPALIGFAREKGRAGYVGDGANRWPAGHTLDAARLYRLALESARPGTRLHAIGDEGVPFREIADLIGRKLGVESVSIPAEDQEGYFSFLARFVGADNPATSELTREWLGWKPTNPGLLEDLEEGNYFDE